MQFLKDSDDFDFLPSDRWSYLTESFQFLGEPFEILQTCIISELYFTILGSLSLGTEAMLAAPQFLKNYRSGSTTGMSIFMVLGWLCGDLFKVIYFYLLRTGSKIWRWNTARWHIFNRPFVNWLENVSGLTRNVAKTVWFWRVFLTCTNVQIYRGYHITLYNLFFGWHTLECNIWFWPH